MRLLAHIIIIMMTIEHRIGLSSGQDPRYLAKLRADITRWQGIKLRAEVNSHA